LNNRCEKVLKALLSRCPEPLRNALERFLPEHERLALEKLPSFEESTPDEGYAHAGTLDAIHWSWLVPILKSYSTREQRLYLSALDRHTAESIAGSLEIARVEEKISAPARDYLREQLLKALSQPNSQILPPEYLPASTLNRLLLLSKKDLIRLIDFLALHDLSIEFRQIVETKMLKKIYSFLSEEQKTFLQQITSSLEPNPFGKLGLDRWDGTPESLRTLLHRRGLMRLGAGLFGQDPDLIWTLCHQLDSGRGGVLMKLCTKETATETTKRQIEELMGKL